jgi:hypothetical protein
MRAELFITAQEELELLDELEALVPAESSPHRSPSRHTRKAVLTKGILSHTCLEGIGLGRNFCPVVSQPTVRNILVLSMPIAFRQPGRSGPRARDVSVRAGARRAVRSPLPGSCIGRHAVRPSAYFYLIANGRKCELKVRASGLMVASQILTVPGGT